MTIRRDAFYALRVRARALLLEQRRRRLCFALQVISELSVRIARELDALEIEANDLWDAIAERSEFAP